MPGQLDQIMGMLGSGNSTRGSGQFGGPHEWDPHDPNKQRTNFAPPTFETWARSVYGNYGVLNSAAPERRAEMYAQYQGFLAQQEASKAAELEYSMKQYAHNSNRWVNNLNSKGYGPTW